MQHDVGIKDCPGSSMYASIKDGPEHRVHAN